MKSLIIVESPAKARTLGRFLGKDYQIEATMGHLRDLPERRFGVKTTDDFEPDYVLIPKKKEIVERLKLAVGKAEKIYLATDPDREGEAIAWHAAQLLMKKSKPTRIVFHEITKTAIEKAIQHPRAIDMDLVDAQQARRILDRVVGYKLSPLLWYKIRKGLSAGRVQSVAVKLIVDREREIEKFVPIEYWEIFCDLKKYLGSSLPDAPIFRTKLTEKNGDKLKIDNQEQSDEVVSELEKSSFEIEDILRKEIKRSPLPPFTTSTLQQTAVNRLGWSSKRAMQVAQSLYEEGLITYHRTDSTNIADEAVTTCRSYILSNYGKDYLPEQPRFYKTKSKVAQEAHEAIRPTEVTSDMQQVTRELEKDKERLYELIWKRFVACQMNEAVYDETKILVLAAGNVNHYQLEAVGKIIKFAGWLTLYDKSESKSDGESEGDEGEQMPEMNKGEELVLIKIDPLQKFTQPSSRFNEASLIKTLEEYGIGRPSTYAPIISTIQDRQYVERTEGRFAPTSLGVAVNDFLVEYFPEIVNLEFTAQMEDDLDQIADGKKEWVPVIREFYEPFNTKLNTVSKIAERVAVETEVTDEVCPECGAPLVVRLGRFGKFLSCSKFPDCKFTKPYLKEAGFTCPKCGRPVVVKRTKKGKTFYGCSSWPKCDFATWRKPKEEKAQKLETMPQ